MNSEEQPLEETQQGPADWKETVEMVHKWMEQEEGYLKQIESRVTKEITLHHMDYHTLLKKAGKNLKEAMQLTEKLEEYVGGKEKWEPDKVVEIYKKIFENMGEVDQKFTEAFLSTIFILRGFAAYYTARAHMDQYFDKLAEEIEGSGISEKERTDLENIRRREELVYQDINDIVISLNKTTHRELPRGALMEAASSMRRMVGEEGVKLDAILKRRWLGKQASGKALVKEGTEA